MMVRRAIPHLFTTGNLVGGILAIIFILEEDLIYVPLLLLFSATCDFIDGFAARKLKVESELGGQLDSLADMVTFGLAPGLLVYKILDLKISLSKLDLEYLPYIGLVIPVAAMFRLAIFNLNQEQKDYFRGIPTPAVTIFYAAIPLILSGPYLRKDIEEFMWTQEIVANPLFLSLSVVFFAVLMLIPFRMFSLKFKKFSWKGNEIRYVFLTISMVLLATLLAWGLPLIIPLYIVLSLVDNYLIKSVGNEIQS